MTSKAAVSKGRKARLARIVAETVVINPPHFTERRTAMAKLAQKMGIESLRFSDGVVDLPHQQACTQAHRAAMQSLTEWPSLVLEDDLELFGRAQSLPPLPPDADIIYLFVTPFGCLPWTRENLDIARHRALKGLNLASRHDANWLKLHSMSGAVAILYVTEKGRNAWVEATMQAERFGGPFDVFTAYAMQDLNVYAPHAPVFRECADLQRDTLLANPALLQRRLDFTRTPLSPRDVGDREEMEFRGQDITFEVTEAAPGKLIWSVVSIEGEKTG